MSVLIKRFRIRLTQPLLCCGWSWRSRWCVLDTLTRCKVKAVCDKHDRIIAGYADVDGGNEAKVWVARPYCGIVLNPPNTSTNGTLTYAKIIRFGEQ